ncbi:hypothetical protein ACP275_13G155600 [Erythranthe tilingii]
MIARTNGRRSRGPMRSNSDVVSGSPSQEYSEDVFNFTLSSEDSGRRHLSGPYSFTSSKEKRRSTILPSRNGGDCGDHDGGLRKRKRKVVDVDSLPYGVLGFKKKPKNFMKINSTLRKCSSSRESENRVFEFSDDRDFSISNTKNVDSGSYGLNSSQDLRSSGPRKCERKRDVSNFTRVCGISKKKAGKENGVLKKTRKKLDSKFRSITENVDGVNFALDGLKKGSHLKIRRASLVSLLSVCRTNQQRQLLRVNGMAKNIIDVVSRLGSHDQPSNLAAATLVYLLTSDGEDDCVVDSPSCICFLIKSLKPLTPRMCRRASLLQDSIYIKDSSATAIMTKVREILRDCKEMKSRDYIHLRLNPKWISLLTMEKACLSIEDAASTVRKTGVSFKEILREFGGLDAVFEVARNCHCIMEEWLEKSPNFALDLKDNAGLESLLLLLKCLKVMENATDLSQDNQCHLLRMNGKTDGQRAPLSLTTLILSVVKILSGVSLFRSSSSSSTTQVSFSGISGNSDSSDPFTFRWDEFGPSKWALLSETADKVGPTSAGDGEKSNLIADCLLTAVKVFINLTNDNPEGCQQIAKCGGLETFCSLIARHFPSNSSLTIDQPSDTRLTDREHDFLVAILVLLVNLVEKDRQNRSKLVAARVSLPRIDDLELEDQTDDAISLLCSIFLANRAGGKYLCSDDEESVLQREKEADKMIIEAYAALLLAFLSMESKSTRNAIAECFPGRNLAILVPVLERFAVFHVTLNMISPETHEAVLEVIESCRIP